MQTHSAVIARVTRHHVISHSHPGAHSDPACHTCRLTHSAASTRSWGRGGCPSGRLSAPLARPVGLIADAKGYFKPGSMGDFLVTQAWEGKRQGAGALELCCAQGSRIKGSHLHWAALSLDHLAQLMAMYLKWEYQPHGGSDPRTKTSCVFQPLFPCPSPQDHVSIQTGI